VASVRCDRVQVANNMMSIVFNMVGSGFSKM
jgi:hypothetical protein